MTAALQQHVRSAPLRRSCPWLWASILGVGLAACAPAEVGPNPNLGWIEAGSPKKLEVDRADYRHAVYFETDKADLPAVEQDGLLTFLSSVAPTTRDTIRLEGHADERATDLYNLELAARRANAVAAFLRRHGYERYLVTLPGCPDWSRESGTDFANLPHSNFGCATQSNLGLMVAEPRDLVRGRNLAPADGAQQADGIVRYRTGKVIELRKEKVEN
jgi:pilus assembly protein CpaD